MTHENANGQRPSTQWTGKTSFEVTIPELGRISKLMFTQAICLSLSVSILILSLMIMILSHGMERSDIGALVVAGISLFAMLGVVVGAELKINKLTPVVDQAFNDTVKRNLHMEPINGTSIALRKTGYTHLTDGVNISMWEIYYFSDRTDVVSFEKFSVSQYNRYLEDGTIKVAS